MSTRHRIRETLETGLTRLGFFWIPLWPRKLVVSTALFLGWCAFHADKRSRNIGLANLDLAFGDTKTPYEKRRILLTSMQSFSLAMLDLVWFTRNAEARIEKWATLTDHFREHAFLKKAQIGLSAHYGNWELGGHIMAAKGYSLHSVAAAIRNPGVDKLLTRQREQLGQKVVPQKGAIRHLLKVLKEEGKVALLLDQNTRQSQGGLFVPFFGRLVPMSGAVARLALKTQSDIFIGFAWADSKGHYTLDCTDYLVADNLPDASDPEAPILLTRMVAKRIEEAIRKRPEHWLWSYKRWKLVPPGENPDRYPFYSHPIRKGDE